MPCHSSLPGGRDSAVHAWEQKMRRCEQKFSVPTTVGVHAYHLVVTAQVARVIGECGLRTLVVANCARGDQFEARILVGEVGWSRVVRVREASVQDEDPIIEMLHLHTRNLGVASSEGRVVHEFRLSELISGGLEVIRDRLQWRQHKSRLLSRC